jgi:hypothetical protein
MADDDLAPKRLADHERPLGAFGADSSTPYSPLRSLEEAQAVPDGVVILQGDEGGQIYVVCPAAQVRCSTEALETLLLDLDALAWNEPESAHIYFERKPVGAGVAGGMGGGLVAAGPWIHEAFVKLLLSESIGEVLRGNRRRIR